MLECHLCLLPIGRCHPQVTSTLGEEETREARVREQLVPCIAEFGAASGRDVLWKRLNQRLLLHSRHRSPQVGPTHSCTWVGVVSVVAEGLSLSLCVSLGAHARFD